MTFLGSVSDKEYAMMGQFLIEDDLLPKFGTTQPWSGTWSLLVSSPGMAGTPQAGPYAVINHTH